MPRPQKATADYFQHHVKRGKTMFTLESKYGNDGYALWFKTLELLTSTEHHYLNFTDESLWEYYLTFVNLNETKTMEILTLLSKLNAIDADLWKVKIVWCENLIANLSGLYNKRTVKPLDKSQIIIVSGAEIPNNNSFRGINPHSIVENRIEEDSIAEETTATPFYQFSDDEMKCKNDYEFTIYPFYQIHKRYNPKFPLVMGNIPPVDIKSCVDNILLFQKECKKCGVDYVEYLIAKLIQSSWATKLSNAGNASVRVIGSAAYYSLSDVQKKQELKPKYNYNNDAPVPTYQIIGDDDDD